MRIDDGGAGVAEADGRQVQLLAAEAVEGGAKPSVGVLVDQDVAEVVADGDGPRPRVAHVANARQRVREVLQARHERK